MDEQIELFSAQRLPLTRPHRLQFVKRKPWYFQNKDTYLWNFVPNCGHREISDHGFLKSGTIAKFDRAGFVILVVVFVSQDFQVFNLVQTSIAKSRPSVPSNVTEIEETFCGRTDWRTDNGWMHGRTFETGFIRSTLSKSRPKNYSQDWALIASYDLWPGNGAGVF